MERQQYLIFTDKSLVQHGLPSAEAAFVSLRNKARMINANHLASKHTSAFTPYRMTNKSPCHFRNIADSLLLEVFTKGIS
jgi:hypothetical protein